MNLTKNSFYNPLDQSQIEFIPSHFDVVTESLIPRQVRDSKEISSSSDQPRASMVDNSIASRRGSFAMSEFMSHGLSRINSRNSSLEDTYHLTRISTTESLSSSVLDRIRYKIVLKLNPKERQLIRESWDMILNEDLADEEVKTKPQEGKSFSISNLMAVSSHTSGSKTSDSDSSVLSATYIPEPKGNSTSKSFASSLFCSQFYANLLSMAPELERLYPSIKHQAVAFAGVLNIAITNLENLQVLESYLICLGKRHARILDIEPPHFELMGVAFLKTLQDRFGVRCTIELEEVWSRLYSYLANSILQFGIDPVLQVDLGEDELIFPVPNLVEGSSSTISRLNSNDSHDGAKSLRSMFSGRGHSAQPQATAQNKAVSHAHHQDHASVTNTGHKRVSGSTAVPSRGAALKVSSNIPARKQPQMVNRTKLHDSRSKNKKPTSKLSLSSNEECSIM